MLEQCRDLNELHPKVKELALRLIEECKKQGMNIKISETYRTVERQDYLYAQGRTRSGAIVTQSRGSDMQSYHQWRLAFDIYNNVVGDEYNTKIIAKAGKIGMSLGLEWGGSWRGFVDTPHFQYTFGLSIGDLKKGKKPPTNSVPPTTNTTAPVGKTPSTQTSVSDYEKAIKLFNQMGIINSEEMWLPEPTMKYVKDIVIKIGNYLFKTTEYEESIKAFANAKIIESPEIWLKEKYIPEYVKALLVKTANYIKK